MLDPCNPNSPYQGVIASERPTICMWDSKNPALHHHARLTSPSSAGQEGQRQHLGWREAKLRISEKIHLDTSDFIPSGKASPISFSASCSPLIQGSMRSVMVEPTCSAFHLENGTSRADGGHEAVDQRYLWHLAPQSPSSVMSYQVNILEVINDYTRKKCMETPAVPPLQFQSDHLNAVNNS